MKTFGGYSRKIRGFRGNYGRVAKVRLMTIKTGSVPVRVTIDFPKGGGSSAGPASLLLIRLLAVEVNAY